MVAVRHPKPPHLPQTCLKQVKHVRRFCVLDQPACTARVLASTEKSCHVEPKSANSLEATTHWLDQVSWQQFCISSCYCWMTNSKGLAIATNISEKCRFGQFFSTHSLLNLTLKTRNLPAAYAIIGGHSQLFFFHRAMQCRFMASAWQQPNTPEDWLFLFGV